MTARDPGATGLTCRPRREGGTFSVSEIKETGHRFFGRVSMGFAEAVEYTFQRAGRPNGYILGEEAGGAIIAGVRYGEGTLYTKDAGDYQSIGRARRSATISAPKAPRPWCSSTICAAQGRSSTFAGVDGSAYLIGGVGVTFLARGHVILAPIRSGLGLRLGANVGYLKYTREPTWNPF